MTGSIGKYLALALCCCLSGSSGQIEIHLSGLFPNVTQADGSDGSAIQTATQLAVQHVALHPGLAHLRLRFQWKGTSCDMSVGMKALFTSLPENPQKKGVLAGYCPSVTTPVAQALQQLNIPQVVYADTSPLLSDQGKYKQLIRLVPDESQFAPAAVELIKYFGWSQVSTVFQDSSAGTPEYAYTHSILRPLLERNNITIHSAQTFATDPSISIKALHRSHSRIIVGLFDEKMTKKVFCEAYKAEFYSPNHVWIVFSNITAESWLNESLPLGCSPEHILTAAGRFFMPKIMGLYHGGESRLTIANISSSHYEGLYKKGCGTDCANKFHGYAYDAVWAVTLAMNHLLNEDGMEAVTNLNASHFYEALNQVTFEGVTGNVSFEDGGRLGYIKLMQFCGPSTNSRDIGQYFLGADRLTINESLLCWPNGIVPSDHILKITETVGPTTPISVTVGALSFLGIILALCFLFVNIRFRKTRCIKMSSPNMNNIIIIGCLFIYTSLYLQRVDSNLFSEVGFTCLCSIRTWLLALGFSLSFGAMFSKTWRVYSIFNNPSLQKKVIKDKILFIVVSILVAIDAVILTLWTAIDPLREFQKELPDEEFADRIVSHVIVYCDSVHITVWISIIYVYKGALLLGGCFLAWQTRNVSIPALNDSKYIGMSVYTVVITCVTAVAISFIIQDDPNTRYLIVGLLVVVCTTATLCLVFVPKIVSLRKPSAHHSSKVRVRKKDKTSTDQFTDKSAFGSEQPGILKLEDNIGRLRLSVAKSKSQLRKNIDEICAFLSQLICLDEDKEKLDKLKEKCLCTHTSKYCFNPTTTCVSLQENQDSGCLIELDTVEETFSVTGPRCTFSIDSVSSMQPPSPAVMNLSEAPSEDDCKKQDSVQEQGGLSKDGCLQGKNASEESCSKQRKNTEKLRTKLSNHAEEADTCDSPNSNPLVTVSSTATDGEPELPTASPCSDSDGRESLDPSPDEQMEHTSSPPSPTTEGLMESSHLSTNSDSLGTFTGAEVSLSEVFLYISTLEGTDV